jgi:AhpD family alkylhydroperoxidase
MQTIQPIQDEQRDSQAQRLLDVVGGELGLAPNMMKTMAQSPAALEGYLNLSGALANGVLDPQLREQIALTVAQTNRCEYSLAAHVTLGAKGGPQRRPDSSEPGGARRRLQNGRRFKIRSRPGDKPRRSIGGESTPPA